MMRVITTKDVPAYQPINTEAAKDIVTSEIQDKVKVIDAKNGEYVIEEVAVETSRIDTQEYIDSFKDDVGIENILKKFQLVNDPDLLVQVKRPTVPVADDGMEFVQDYTGLPSDEETALNLAKKAQAEFASLPSELVKGRSFNEFAKTCTKEELVSFLASLKKKEGDK